MVQRKVFMRAPDLPTTAALSYGVNDKLAFGGDMGLGFEQACGNKLTLLMEGAVLGAAAALAAFFLTPVWRACYEHVFSRQL